MKALTYIAQVKPAIMDKPKPVNSKAYNRKKSQAWKRELPPDACDFFLTFPSFPITIA